MSAMTGLSSIGQSTGKARKIKGTDYRQFQTPQFTPQQVDLFQRLFSQTSPNSFLSRLSSGDQSQFEQLEAPALKQFSQLQGGLASRFSGMGTGARKSSGFQNTANTAAQDFAQQLQANRLGLQQKAIEDLIGMSGQLLGQRPYETALVPNKQKQKKPSFWQQLGLGAASGLGQAASLAPFLL